MKLVNIANLKRKIYLFYRNDKGELEIKTDNSFFSYFYEIDPEGQFKSYDGKSLRKIFVSNPSDVPKKRTNNAYEADIVFRKRYLIDKIDKLEKCPVKYAFIDIEVLADELPDVTKAKQTVSCISIYNSFYKSIQTFYLPDYETEYKMLEHFINYMKKEKFDLWLSWNVSFDYNYLYNRIPDFAEKISPVGLTRYGGEDMLYPAGISIVDYLQWFKKITLNREKQYSLDYIAQTHLKEKANEKIDFAKLDIKIKEKNRNDIERMVKLEKKFKIISYFDEIRRMAKVEWEDMIWNSRVLDMLLLQEAKNQKIILPMKPAEERGSLLEKEEYTGAFREAFQTGRFFNVGKYDLSSCYPAMIIDFALDPSNIYTTVHKDSSCIKIENTYFNQNSNALLPTVTKKLLTLKNSIKKKLTILELNSQEYKDMKKKYDAIKSVCNSAYGVFGNRFFRLYSKQVASATTFLVRDLLTYVIASLKSKGNEVIYADTDGIMVNNNTEDISELLNILVRKWAKDKYGKENITTDFGYEGYYEKILILAKCRYKGWLKTDKGIEVETKGIEAKRKDSTEFMKKFQIELIDKIVNKETKENIMTWIKEQIKILPNQPLKDIAFPCKLSRKPEDYKNVPIFLRALNNTPKLNKKVGELYYYIFVKSNEYETCFKIKTLILTYNKDGEKKGFKNLTEKRLEKACEIVNIDIKKYERDELLEELMRLGHVKNDEVEVKGKLKDVVALDEENYKHIKDVDWDRIIERNILMKLTTIFEAMKWDYKELLKEK